MTLQVRKTAVLGAGVMGAQIAAHLANANVPVVLFDLTAKDGDPTGCQKGGRESEKTVPHRQQPRGTVSAMSNRPITTSISTSSRNAT